MSFFSSSTFPKINPNTKVAIVRSEFNKDFTEALREDSIYGFKKCGIPTENIEEFIVPGSMEIPFAVKKLQETREFDGILTLGVVIRGDTVHFDYVCQALTDGLSTCSIQSPIPVISGVIMAENEEQVHARLERGREFASSLVKMMLFNDLF